MLPRNCTTDQNLTIITLLKVVIWEYYSPDAPDLSTYNHGDTAHHSEVDLDIQPYHHVLAQSFW